MKSLGNSLLNGGNQDAGQRSRAAGVPADVRVDPESRARLDKANRKLRCLLNQVIGDDYFGTLTYEMIVAQGKIVQINVSGIEKIR